MATKVNLDVSEKLNITCKKGDTFTLGLLMKDANGVALLATNFTISSTETGDVTITASARVMELVDAGSYVYDIQQINNIDVTTTIFEGRFNVNDDISNYE